MTELLNDPVARIVLAVLVLGLAGLLLARVSAGLSRLLALAAGVLVFSAGLMLWNAGPRDLPAVKSLALALGPVTLGIQFSLSALGNLVVVGSGMFTVLVAIFCMGYQGSEGKSGRFYSYMSLALGGAALVGWAGNFFVLLLGWELVTVMLFLMVNEGTHGSAASAAKTFGVLGFADTCLLMAVALMLGLPLGSPLHNLSLPAVSSPVEVSQLGGMGYLIYALLLIAAFAKAGAMPVHSWIPAIAPNAPVPAMALLPAAVDKLLGIYLLARVSLDIFKPDPAMQGVMLGVGAVTILAAVFMAMIQHNLKRLLSFHAVSQVGYMVLGIGTGTTIGVIGGLFHMINNAIYKSELFLMSGMVGRAAGTDDIDEMGGLARRLPITFACSAVAAAAISGVPPFNGFVSKWMIYQGALAMGSWQGVLLLVVAVFGSALTLASFVKVLYAAFLSRRPTTAPAPSPATSENLWTAFPMIVLAGLCVVLGLFPQLAINVLAPAVHGDSGLSTGLGSVSALNLSEWNPLLGMGLILLGIVGGMIVLAVFARRNVRVVRPYISGEIVTTDDRFRFRGGGFYETIARLPAVGPLLANGEKGALDLYHWCGRYGATVISVLRAQHTGLISLYVAWCVVGFAAVLIYLLVAGRAL